MAQESWHELPQIKPAFNYVQQLVDNWMLVTSGDPDDLGTMTINWGGHGFIWRKNVVFMVIRESRNTLTYLERHPTFSLTMFDESYRDKLTFCGRHTGREVNKLAECQFTPLFYGPEQTPYFDEAHTAIICRQIYRTLMTEDDFIGGVDSDLWQTFYNTGIHTGDRHYLIIASVEKVLAKGDSSYA